VRDDAICQRAIENRDDLVVAFARLGHCHVQAAEFLWDAYGGADFQAAAGEMVQHPDFLHHPGGMIVGQDHAHDAETEFLRARAKRGNQQVG
jgi:hypothetical protein